MGRPTYDRRKAQGLCVRCGHPNPRAPERVACGPCTQQIGQQVLDARDQRLSGHPWKYAKARRNWERRQSERTR
jgi:hypothetical protein